MTVKKAEANDEKTVKVAGSPQGGEVIKPNPIDTPKTAVGIGKMDAKKAEELGLDPTPYGKAAK